MTNLITTTPLIPPIANALEAEAARKEAVEKKIQEIITQYQSLGWSDVRPLDMGKLLPRIVCWKDNAFSIQLELFQAANNSAIAVNFVNIFLTGNKVTNGDPLSYGCVGGFWYQGHDVSPAEVQAIIRLVKGEEIEAKEELEETGALAEYNHRYNK